MSNMLPLDFQPIIFSGAKKNHGEDNLSCGFCNNSGIIAVFDGCGGSGARKHEDYANHSEAFMASRLCSGTVYACIQEHFPLKMEPYEFAHEILSPSLEKVLQANVPEERPGSIKIKGMCSLPTTMAAILLQSDHKAIRVSPIWAGDSRAYILDHTGLSQLMVDDSDQTNPIDCFYESGAITNLLCSERPVHLSCQSYRIELPFLAIVATDGCFDYVSTPMEFEGMILHTLLESSSVAQWETNLKKLIASYSGDDHTLCLVSLGFGSFEAIQKHFAARYSSLRRTYLETVWATPLEDREIRRNLWNSYRPNYMKFIEGGKTK